MRVIAAQAIRESLRRRVFAVVLVLSVLFLALYAWGASQLFNDVEEFGGNEFGVDAETLAGATVLGLAMFVVLFLGAVLSTFLTLGAVRGDADRGLLQPLIVRPLGRPAYLGGRLLAAGAVSAVYVVVLFGACTIVIGVIGWWPDRWIAPALGLAAAAVVIAAIGLLGSVLLSSTANGIAVFMVFGAGLTAGLLGQIGEALSSDTLDTISSVATWVLPFEALYQDGLAALTADVKGTTAMVVNLGPFGARRREDRRCGRSRSPTSSRRSAPPWPCSRGATSEQAGAPGDARRRAWISRLRCRYRRDDHYGEEVGWVRDRYRAQGAASRGVGLGRRSVDGRALPVRVLRRRDVVDRRDVRAVHPASATSGTSAARTTPASRWRSCWGLRPAAEAAGALAPRGPRRRRGGAEGRGDPARPAGFEPATSRSGGERSIH